MKSCKETVQSEITGPSVAVPCVKYPSKPLLMKSRVLTDYSRLSSRASISKIKNPNVTDPLEVQLGKPRNIKIGSRKPPKNLVTKNIHIRGIEERVRVQEKLIIKRSYSHDSLKVTHHHCEGNPNLPNTNPATAHPNHSYHLRKTRRSLEPISSFEKGEENLTKLLFPIDPNNTNSYHNSLKNMEKSMILRKRRKITMTGGDQNIFEDFKENVPHLQQQKQLQENNLGSQAGNLSINGEKRTLSGQKGYPMMEKKNCIKNSEHRMTWIL